MNSELKLEKWNVVNDQYEVLALIGYGEYGQVVKARERSNG